MHVTRGTTGTGRNGGRRPRPEGDAGGRPRTGHRPLAVETLEHRRVLAASGYIYGIAANNHIYQIDVNAQAATDVFDAVPFVGSNPSSNGFAYDNVRNQFFFVAPDNSLQYWDGGTALKTVATAAQLGMTALSTRPDNAAYYGDSFWYFTRGTNTLNKVSLTYSASQPAFASLQQFAVANTPTAQNLFGDIAVNCNTGILYAATETGLFYTLDISSGSPTNYAAVTSGNPSLQLSFNGDYSTLYGQVYTGGVWYTVDPSTGATTVIPGFTTPLSGGNGLRDLGGAALTSWPRADLKIAKTDGVTTVIAGAGTVQTYTITVNNLGPSTAENVSVADSWPAGFLQGAFGTPSQGGITPGAAGNFTWAIGSLAAGFAATLTVSYTVPFGTAPGAYTNTATVTSTTPDPVGDNTATDTTTVVFPSVLVAGNDIGCDSTPRVYVINPYSGAVVSSFLAYADTSFRGGVRVAIGDLDNNGVPEVVVAPGPGRVGEVKAFAIDGTPLPGFTIRPFGAAYRNGIELAVGDIDGDGKDDLVAAKSSGAGDVRVAVSNGTAFTPVPSKSINSPFPRASGGASVAVGGINRIVLGSGFGMPPTVRTYDVSGATPKIVGQFLPSLPPRTAGISVSTQYFAANPVPDMVVAAGRNGGSVVGVYNGQGAKINGYKAFASLAKPNAPVYAGAAALNGAVVDTVFMAQGDGGRNGIKKLNASTGAVDPAFAPVYAGKPLLAPLRIATRGPRS